MRIHKSTISSTLAFYPGIRVHIFYVTVVCGIFSVFLFISGFCSHSKYLQFNQFNSFIFLFFLIPLLPPFLLPIIKICVFLSKVTPSCTVPNRGLRHSRQALEPLCYSPIISHYDLQRILLGQIYIYINVPYAINEVACNGKFHSKLKLQEHSHL